MSTLRVNTLQNAAGTGQPAMSGAAKAWVNFNGTGTVAIRAAFNVSSITDSGLGYYTVNFSTAFSDANYSSVIGGASTSTVASGGPTTYGANTSLPTTTTIVIRTWSDSTSLDWDLVNLTIFR